MGVEYFRQLHAIPREHKGVLPLHIGGETYIVDSTIGFRLARHTSQGKSLTIVFPDSLTIVKEQRSNKNRAGNLTAVQGYTVASYMMNGPQGEGNWFIGNQYMFQRLSSGEFAVLIEVSSTKPMVITQIDRTDNIREHLVSLVNPIVL